MENEKRLIDANALHASVSKKLMTDVFPNWKEFPRDVQEKLTRLGKEHERFLFEAPTVDAVEVVHGRWIGMEEEIWGRNVSMVTMWQCSACGVSQTTLFGRRRYCPNCGAKMDGDGNV